MKRFFKGFLSLFVSFCLISSGAYPASAASVNLTSLPNTTQLSTINGEVVKTTILTDNANIRTVKVEENNNITIVTYDKLKDTLNTTVTNNLTKAVTNSTVVLKSSAISNKYAKKSSGKNSPNDLDFITDNYSPFWGYDYYESYDTDYGEFLWSIDSGSTGSNELYESNSARTTDLNNFKSSVDNIVTQQDLAIGAMGAALAAVAAGVVSSATGVGAIIGAIVALGGTSSAAALWVSAWVSSNSADGYYNRLLYE